MGHNTSMTSCKIFASVLSFLICFSSSKSGWSGNKIFAEGLNYTNRPVCGQWSQLAYTTQNASAFYSSITQLGSAWTTGNIYLDSLVWDSDFVDPEKNFNGADSTNFDQANYGLSYFTGHGSSFDYSAPQYNCTSHSNCTSPAPSQTPPAQCLYNPGTIYGTCFYGAEHLIGTCGSNPKFGNMPNAVSGIMKFGESTNSGTWAGAGTNGGINVAIIDNSNTLRSPAFGWQSIAPMFAGVHMIGVVMPIGWGSDNLDNQEVGPTFATRLRSNSSASVAEQWLLSLNDVSASLGSSCGVFPGGHGIGGATYGGGCGGRYIASLGQSCSFAQNTILYQNTTGAQSDANDATGSACLAYDYICNYDCQTYPFNKG